MSKELPTTVEAECVDFKRLSKTGLDACLDELLAQPATSQQASELQCLLHELQVHQIELEIQNRELRESQQLLEEARDLYADLYDFAPVGYLTLDSKAKIIDINLRGAVMLGRERNRLVGLPLVSLLAPGESRILFEHLAQVFQTTASAVHELRLKPVDGRSRVVRIYSVAEKSRHATANSCHAALVDISQQRQAEDALKQSELRFRAIFEQAAVGVALIDSFSGKFQRVNQKYSDIIGYSIEEMQTLDFMQISHPEDLPLDLNNTQKLQAGEIREFTLEKRLYRKDGSIVWVAITVSPMWDVGEVADFYIAIVEDISQRKQAETVLAGRNEVLELMSKGANLDEVLTRLVIKAEATYPGMLFAVLVQQPGQDQLHPYTSPALAEFYADTGGRLTLPPESGFCATAEFADQQRLIENIMLQPSCDVCHDASCQTNLTHAWCEPVCSATGEVLGVFTSYSREVFEPKPTDLEFFYGTARLAGIAIERDLIDHQSHQHQAELAHMARLNMMGEMATGMAHELNQPLAAIATYADVALRLQGADNKQPELLEEALQGARQQAIRASEIIRHLRQLVRKQAPQKTEVDINALVAGVVGFIQFEARKHEIQVTLQLDETLSNVSIDSIQLEQVLLNLVRNSIEALQAVADKKREVSIHTSLNRDGWLQLEVADNGPGMDAEILSNLFKPFVTTKGAAGMGMGLSISHSIIEAHGGQLWAESKAGQGARFVLTLPLNARPTQE